jgi:hypothetical protein
MGPPATAARMPDAGAGRAPGFSLMFSVRAKDRVRSQRYGQIVCALALCACASGKSGTTPKPGDIVLDAGPAPSVRAVYKLSASPMRFLDIPWPDDNYLGAKGRVAVREIPSQAPTEYARALATAMNDLDGFGLRPTIYFKFDGALDPSSLPKDASATLDARSSVFLIDADTSSPEAFKRIAIESSYDARSSELRLRPAAWRALYPGRRYAAVVTSAVTAVDGSPVGGATNFLRLRDLETSLADPRERAAQALYAPILQTLAGRGVAREHVVALAVFRVQGARADLMSARELVRKGAAKAPNFIDALGDTRLDEVLGTTNSPSVGLDADGPHDHIGWMIQGSFASPNLLSASSVVHGAFEHVATGELRVKRMDDVYFTLWLPRGNVANATWPVAIVQHGAGGDRSDALPLANALAASGYAVIAIDAPFLGSRSSAGDNRNRFTGAMSPDGFGDAPGDFIGQADTDGDLTELHPFYYRDAVRQGVVDLAALVYVLQSGDWSALGQLNPAFSGLKLSATTLPFVGIDLGGEMGVMLSSVEPSVSALALGFAGGLTVDGWLDSPRAQPMVDALLARLGRDRDSIDWSGDSPFTWPDVDAWRTLTDRASALAYAPALRGGPDNVLMFMAQDDELVHNRSTETLANVLGAELVGGDPQFVLDLRTHSIRPGGTLSANFPPESGSVTRVLYMLDPATHDALTLEHGTAQFDHPAGGLKAPFSQLSKPETVDNPIAQTMTQIAFFFASLRTCSMATSDAKPTCAASVQAPASNGP